MSDGKYLTGKQYYKLHDRNKFREIVRNEKTRWRMRTGSFKYPSREWEEYEDRLVLEHKVTDRELSELIQRSVLAIQIRRSRLKNGSV